MGLQEPVAEAQYLDMILRNYYRLNWGAPMKERFLSQVLT